MSLTVDSFFQKWRGNYAEILYWVFQSTRLMYTTEIKLYEHLLWRPLSFVHDFAILSQQSLQNESMWPSLSASVTFNSLRKTLKPVRHRRPSETPTKSLRKTLKPVRHRRPSETPTNKMGFCFYWCNWHKVSSAWLALLVENFLGSLDITTTAFLSDYCVNQYLISVFMGKTETIRAATQKELNFLRWICLRPHLHNPFKLNRNLGSDKTETTLALWIAPKSKFSPFGLRFVCRMELVRYWWIGRASNFWTLVWNRLKLILVDKIGGGCLLFGLRYGTDRNWFMLLNYFCFAT